MSRRHRPGFSLLEVLLATSILIGSAIVLMELVSIGGRHASSARDLAKSQLICQSKLNEILARVAPIEPVRPTPLEDDPQWVYWVDVQPLRQPGLSALHISAARELPPNKQSARFTLTRWIRDRQAGRGLGNEGPGTEVDPAPGDTSLAPPGAAQGPLP